MAEQTANMKQMQILINCTNRANAALKSYEDGKVTLFNGMEVPIAVAQITALKADFVATRTAAIEAWNAITG